MIPKPSLLHTWPKPCNTGRIATTDRLVVEFDRYPRYPLPLSLVKPVMQETKPTVIKTLLHALETVAGYG